MAQQTVWTKWQENPIAAAYEVARVNNIDTKEVDNVLLKIVTWQQFDAVNFMDDLLQEIAGETNIVVQYSKDRNEFRAALDL